MKTILVGTDGSPGADQALRWAAHLASAHDAELVVMTGFVPNDSELPPDRAERLMAEQHELLDTWSEPARLGDLRVRTVVERGDARESILKVAASTDADLIVVGRVGTSSGPGLFRVGSAAEHLAHVCDRPLAVVNRDSNPVVRSILVGVDGSEHAGAALDWVAESATRTGARVVVATVDQPLIEWTIATSSRNWRRHAEKQLREEWAAGLTEAGVDFDALVLRGSNAADTLLRTAKRERADVVVVGMRGLGGFSGLRAGRVALRVLHRAGLPVVLVPPKE